MEPNSHFNEKNKKRAREVYEEGQTETAEEMLVRENKEKAEEQRLIEAQMAAMESDFWLKAAMEIQNTIAKAYEEGLGPTNEVPIHDARLEA